MTNTAYSYLRNAASMGGRLTRIGKRAVSYAPLLGLFCATALFGPSPAQAADECGTEAIGADAITCAPGNYAGGSAYPDFPNGITYNGSDGLSLTLDDPSITVGGDGVSISSSAVSTGDLELIGTSFGTIAPVDGGPGLQLSMPQGAAGSGTLIVTDGFVSANSAGVIINSSSSSVGDLLVQMSGGEITTDGFQANGLQIFQSTTADDSTGTKMIKMTDGSILAQGNSADGITMAAQGDGDTEVSVSGGLITVRNDLAGTARFANGIASYVGNSDSTANSSVSVTNGEIDIESNGSLGIFMNNSGTGKSQISLDGNTSVLVNGAGSVGVQLESGNAGIESDFNINISGTSSISGGTSTAGLVTNSLAGLSGEVSLGASTEVDFSTGAAAIADGSGNVTIRSGGVVFGDALLGLGDDTFELTGGTYTGDIYGDEVPTGLFVDPAGVVGNDTFTWSGGDLNSGFFGGNGSDVANISAGANYDGTETLDGGDDLGVADGWVDTLTFQGQTATMTGALVINWENVIIDGGSLALTDSMLTVGSDAGTGLTLTNGGALDAGGGFALAGNLATSAGGTFDRSGGGTGVYSVSGSVLNNGVLTTQGGAVGDVVAVAGNYGGTGLLRLDANTATNTADVLNVAGDVTGGSTTIAVNNLNPLVATGNDITVVTVGGTSSAGDFVLQGGALTAGAFDYTLADSGTNFVLAAAVNSTGAVYEAAPSVLGGFNRLPTLQQRVGQRQWTGQSGALAEGQPSTGAWVRFSGDRLDATTTTGSSIDSSTWGLQAGVDFAVETGGAGQWVLGATGQYGQVSSTVNSALGFGTIDAEGFGLGATATWYGNAGTYVDLQGQVNWIDSDLTSSAVGSLAEGELSKAYALSAEVGHRFALNQTSALVPQAQLTLGRIDGGSFTDSAGNAVDLGSNDRTIGRIGLAYEYTPDTVAEGNQTKAYVIGSILHDFSSDSSVQVGGASLSSDAAESTWGEIGVGGSYAIGANTILYGEAAYRTAFGGNSDNSGLSGSVGLRIQW